MYLNMLQKANSLLYRHHISEYPVPIHIMESIVQQHEINIVCLKNWFNSMIIGDELLIGTYEFSSEYRYKLMHELSHYLCHEGNCFIKDSIQNLKNEKQADALSAYFLMPVYVFEKHLEYTYNDYELCEIFGVPIELLLFRKYLTTRLLENNTYDFMITALSCVKHNII